ncbi:PilZ domain-containing protein [Desulfopila sp. IMCC35008]|uniref:PilZ domain-containing protein n=1 Tax=Desulfopila sp. IMCC35008 TaxID=2653858 RepID=UPI0013D36528|nr:PilZ domain-containing protein [Desulfopila sp. IMCC35008]
MMKEAEVTMQKVFVGPDNKVVLSCPACAKSKSVDVTKYFSSDGPVNLTYRFKCEKCDCGHRDCETCVREKCSLGHRNTVRLERRKHVRKETRLNGTFQTGKARPKEVVVLDISRHGARFELSPLLDLLPGSPGLLDFRLDDQKATPVLKEGKVLRVSNNQAVFLFKEVESYSAADKAIGFYLLK